MKTVFSKLAALIMALCLLLSACAPDNTAACQHSYDHGCDTVCNECGEERVARSHSDPDGDGVCNECGDRIPTPECEHAYDNACDTECNECGEERATSHVYDNACDTECNECGESREAEEHVDGDGNLACDECGASLPAPECEHVYDNTCDTECNKCGEERATFHVYDNACDTECNECGESREAEEHADGDCDGKCDGCGTELETPVTEPEIPALSAPVFDLSAVPEFDNSRDYVPIGDNIPFFTKNQIVAESYEYYSENDSLGRAGVAVACLGTELFPDSGRGSLPDPVGWHSGSIYERCHLIAHSLAGCDERTNLITGTYDLNGVMQEFEEMVKAFIIETDYHVMYRVTPVYVGDELLARGVILEGYSVEDEGDGICFNIYIYNEQDDEIIDHATGDVTLPEREYTFVVNKRNGKIHTADCRNVAGMNDENKITWTGSYAELIAKLNADGVAWSNGGCCSPQNSTAGQVLFTLPKEEYLV